ncbi:MAG: T9SS type A sorting domain-containing protein [Saprospiraceae bacterium]
MRRFTLFFLLFFLFVATLPAQETRFVSSANQWNISNSGSPFSPPVITNFKYRFAEDSTEMNGQFYYQLLSEDEEFGEDYEPTNYAFRQEGNKVYLLSSSSDDEIIYYDFDLVVGDTFYAPLQQPFPEAAAVVASVDTVTYDDGVMRKRIVLTCYDEPEFNYTWVEGIGDLRGIFNVESLCFLDGFSYQLNCFSVNDTILYAKEEELICWVYPPLPDLRLVRDNNQWIIANGLPSLGEPTVTKKYRLTGDSLEIDGRFYRELLREPQRFGVNFNDSTSLYYRQEGQRVYRKAGNDQEGLLYDFSLEAGDEFIGGPPAEEETLYVISTDSIVLENGIVAKRLHLSCDEENSGTEQVTWIEGIGSLRGLNYRSPYCISIGSVDELICFSRFGGALPDYVKPGEDDCWINTATENLVRKNLTIYPNPTDRTLFLEIPDEDLIDRPYRVTSLTGREVARGITSGRIDLPATLPTGAYLLQLRFPDGVGWWRFVKR